jgi:hypothetical protein
MPSESAADTQRRLSNDVAGLAFDAIFVLTGTTSIGTPQQQRDHLIQNIEDIQSTFEAVRHTNLALAATVLVRSNALLAALRQGEPSAADPALFSDFFAAFGLYPPFLQMLEDARRNLAD